MSARGKACHRGTARARFRLRFERRGPACWWDPQRYLAALRDALRSTGLDARPGGAYITAAPTAPPGCASAHEYADLALGAPCTCAVLRRLFGGALASGLRLLSVVRLPVWALDIRAALRARCYEALCPPATPAQVAAFMAATVWPCTRWKKGRERVLDVRAAVTDMHCLSGRVRFALECSDTAPKPAEVLASVFALPWAEAFGLPLACTGVRMAAQPAYRG